MRMSEKKAPILSKQEIQRMYKQSIEDYESALDLEVPQGLFRYIQAPAIIVISSTLAYFLGRLGFSIFGLILVIYTSFFIFRRRMTNFKRSLESLVLDSVRKRRVLNTWEGAEWMNHAASRFWTVLEPMVAEEVFRNLNTFLYENCPPFLHSLRLTEFTLGSVSPRVLGILFYEKVGEENIQMDIEINFNPLEASKEAVSAYIGPEKGYNSRICLNAALGGSNINISLPILVKKIGFSCKLRIILTLGGPALIKEAEIMLLEQPHLDFTLRPLKAVDLMDLPGLSNWISNIIQFNLSNHMVNPQSIKLNLERMREDKKVVIGILQLQLIEYYQRDTDSYKIEIDIDGKRLFTTSEYVHPYINEYFYLKITNVDDYINFNQTIRNSYRGSLSIKKIIRGNHIDTVKLMYNDKVMGTLICGMHYYKIDKKEVIDNDDTNKEFKQTNQNLASLVKMGINQIDQLPSESARKCTTCCSVVVSPDRLTEKETDSFKLFNVLGGIFGALGKKEKLLPSSPETLFVYKTKTIVESNSPKYNDECVFFSRDPSKDILKVCVVESSSEKILGTVEMPVAQIRKGVDWHRLSLQRGRIQLSFDTTPVPLRGDPDLFVSFDRLLQIDIKDVQSIFGAGNYSAIVTSRVGKKDILYKVETFNVGLADIKRRFLLPLSQSTDVSLDIYKENIRDETFIGRGIMKLERGVVIEDIVIKSDDIESGTVSMSISEQQLTVYKGVNDISNQAKLIQVKFSEFQGLDEDFRIEFRNDDEVIDVSRIRSSDQVFQFITGEEEVRAYFKSLLPGKDILLGEIIVPKRNCDERVFLKEKVSARMIIRVSTCTLTHKPSLKKGILRIRINSVNNIKGTTKGGLRNPFCKVLLNGEQIYRTETKKKCLNAVYNEEIDMAVDRRYDIVRIVIMDWAQFEASTVLGVTDVPLCFVEEGASIHKLLLTEQASSQITGASVEIVTSFMRGESKEKKKSGLFGNII